MHNSNATRDAAASPPRSPWYREPTEHDYYSSAQVEQFDVADVAGATSTTRDQAVVTYAATPNARVSHQCLDSFIQCMSMSHAAVTAFDGIWSFIYRYVTRSKIYVDLYEAAQPPWRDHHEAMKLMESSVGGGKTTNESTTASSFLLHSELAAYRVLQYNALKAYSMRYNHQRSMLSAERPTFTYTRHTVEVHFDQLKSYPPGTSPMTTTTPAATSSAPQTSFIDQHGAAYFAHAPTEVMNATHADIEAMASQTMSPEEAMAKGIDLQGEIWAVAHRILVRREITERWVRPGVIIEESSRAYPTQLMTKEYPQGEHFMVGHFRDMVGSTTSPTVPRNLINPTRLAQLQKMSTPRTLEESGAPGGFMVVNGKGRFPTFFLSRCEHSLLLCKSAGNGKPMGVIHFDNPLTGSRDNVMIRMCSAKSIVYKKDEVASANPLMQKVTKTRIGTSNNRSVLSFLEQERTTRPNYSYQHVMDLATTVAVANKYVPGHGNSCGLDARYQVTRIMAAQQHMYQFRRAAAGLPTHAMSNTHVDPYDHSAIKDEEINCTKVDRERIGKIEKMVSVNTRSTEVLHVQVYIQRIMILLPVVELYLAYGFVTRAEFRRAVGHADEQFDQGAAAQGAAAQGAAAQGAAAPSDPRGPPWLGRCAEFGEGPVERETQTGEFEGREPLTEPPDDGPCHADAMVDELSEMLGVRRRGDAPTHGPMALVDQMEMEEDDEDARARGLPCTPAPVPHRPPTVLFEKRRLYTSVLERSFDMYECIPEDQRQTRAITHLGELYGSNIQPEHRNRTPYEFGLYFLDQCCLSMQGMLTKLRDDFENDVPIVQSIRQGADGSFRGSHTFHTVVLDEQTKRTFWSKGMSLSINIVNPFLRDWCGFRGAQHGQRNSLDEHQCESVADTHKFHFRNGVRESKGTMLKDYKRDLGTLFLPVQQWFEPAKACARVKHDSAVESAKMGHSIDAENAGVDVMAASSVAMTTATAGSAITIRSIAPPPHFMQNLAREYPNAGPVTHIMRKLTTKYEEDTRRSGTATFQLYQPLNATNVFTGPRRVVAISNAHAGAFLRQYKNNFQSMFCFYGTTTNESSGQNNTLSTTATVSRALTQLEHVSVYHFVERLTRLRWIWSIKDVYWFWVHGKPIGDMWPHAPAEHFYSLVYGTDFLGWFHRDDFERVYHAWFMFKTHPNATDGIRFLSLETIHVKRELRIHMNPGRPTRLTWVVDVKEKTLRATRVSRRLRTLFSTPADKLRAEDRMTSTQLFEELMVHRCVEWMDYFQARHMVVASSMAAFEDSRLRSDVVYGAVEYHPAGHLEPTALAIAGIEHNGGTRTHAATQMARAFTGHTCGSFATNGEMRTPFTLVYPQRPVLRTAGPVADSKDCLQAMVTWVNDPYTDQDSSIQSYTASDFGSGLIMMNESVKVVHDLTRPQAEQQLRVMSATSMALPTQLQKQQAQAALTRQIHHDTLKSSRHMASLVGSPHAATAIFGSLQAEEHARAETVRQHMLGWHTASLAGGGRSGGTGAHLGAGDMAGGGGGGGGSNYVPLDRSMVDAMRLSSSDPYPRDPLSASLTTHAQMAHFQATYLLEQDNLPPNWTELRALFAKMPLLKSGMRVTTAQSMGPVFDWQMYCEMTGQSRNTLETDMFVDSTNTVSFPAVVTSGMTLVRSAVLTPALMQLHAVRKHMENESKRRHEYLRRSGATLSLATLQQQQQHGDIGSGAAAAVVMLPPVEYHRRALRSKKPYMEVTAVRWTLGEFDRQLINVTLGHLHQFSLGDKFTNKNGQKSVVSLYKHIYAHPFAATDEFPGMHAQIQRAAQNQPTRRTVADHISMVATSMACVDPSRKLYTTYGDTYQQMPLMFNEMTAALQRRYNEVLGFNPHMLERMETKKNHSRFGKLLQREITASVTATVFEMPTIPLVDPLVMHQFREQTIARSTAAILQVSEWWSDVDYSETVQHRWRGLGGEGGEGSAPSNSPDGGEEFKLVFSPLLPGGVGGGAASLSSPFAWMLPVVPGSTLRNNNTTAVALGPLSHRMRGWSDQERLMWLWWKDVYVECGQTMHMADAFWADMMHDFTTLSREIDQMHALRDDIVTLGQIITRDLCLNMAQHAYQQHQQQVILHNQQRSHHHGRGHHHHHPQRAYPGAGGGGMDALAVAAPVIVSAESLMEQRMAELLHQKPDQYPGTYADQRRTFDSLCLELLKATHRIGLVCAALLPQVERLERVFVHTKHTLAPASSVWSTAHSYGAFVPLESMFQRMRTFADAIRAHSVAHRLDPTDLLTHAHIQRYVYGAVHEMLNESYAEMHVELRPPPPFDENEGGGVEHDGSSSSSSYWTAETWHVWLDSIQCVHGVATDLDATTADDDERKHDMTDAAPDTEHDAEQDVWYDPATVANDALARQTYGYQRGGSLAAVRDYWHRCWAADFCSDLMRTLTRMPLHLWAEGAAPPPTPPGGQRTLKDALQSHYDALHYLPSTVPQLLDVARLIVLARGAWELEGAQPSPPSPELDLYARALQIETDHVMNAVPEYAIDGETGYPLMGGMWIGVSSENVLNKFAQDLSKVNDGKGPVHVVSGQPADTSDGKGAGRWGKMEIGALTATGSARMTQTVTCEQSDRHDADLCEHCGRPSRYNHLTHEGWCAACDKPSRGQQHTVYANTVINTVCGVAGIIRVADIDRTVNPRDFDRLN